jgi:hypothetical protein
VVTDKKGSGGSGVRGSGSKKGKLFFDGAAIGEGSRAVPRLYCVLLTIISRFLVLSFTADDWTKRRLATSFLRLLEGSPEKQA